MRYLLPLLLALCASTAAQAFDLTTQSLVIAGYATSKVTTAPFDRKLILAAHDDAALNALRQHTPELHASDLELAQAILVQ